MTGWQFAVTEGSQKLTSAALGAYYHKLIEDYPIDSIEDPFAEVRGLHPLTLHMSFLRLSCR
jgi:enolase